jgi:hypothetical protein
MTLFIFVGDMLVMAFMIGVAIWFGTRGKAEAAMVSARIPLEDEMFVVDQPPAEQGSAVEEANS